MGRRMTGMPGVDRDPLIPQVLGESILKHLIALEIRYQRENDTEPRVAVFSGFAIAHRGIMFWVTADHCLKLLKTLRDSPSVRVGAVRWHDRYSHKDAAAIPTDLHTVLRWAYGTDPPDIGIILPRQNVQDLVAANPNVVPLSLEEEIPAGFEHYGYCIAGLPAEAVESIVTDAGAVWITSWTGRVAIITTTLDVTPDGGQLPEGYEAVEGCMYGHIDTKDVIASIEGMSGGPVLGIARRGHEWHWRLVGVQSAWFPNLQIVRIAKIDTVVAFANALCDLIPAAHGQREPDE